MKTLRIYYNDVQVVESPFEVLNGCKYVDIDESFAESFAEDKIESGEWDSYLIPSIATDGYGDKAGVIFH